MVAGRTQEQGDSLFEAIGTFLDAHGLGPDPAHYSFAHAALTDATIAGAVNRLTEGRVRLGRRDIEALGGSIVSRSRSARPAENRRAAELVAQAQVQVDGFADLMRDIREETTGFGRDFAVSAAALGRQPAIEGLDEIARITGAMSARVREAEARLATATAEADALRVELAQAQGEARRDLLTGLPNRLAFEEAFGRADPAAGPVCLGILDIDHFKRLNDRYGHGVGDRVLTAIAACLVQQCKAQMVARHGGEEFAVLMHGLSLDEAAILLDGARACLNEKRFRDRETREPLGQITISAGVVAVAPGENVDAAFARADRLLYAAKAEGRDRVHAE